MVRSQQNALSSVQDVADAGLCTHCGTCVGLSRGTMQMEMTAKGPLPVSNEETDGDILKMAYEACPGKGINYPDMNRFVHGYLPTNWLIGTHIDFFVGYAKDELIRRKAASGGIITQTLLYLLRRKIIDGAVVVIQGRREPLLAEPVIATTEQEILSAAQSVYVPVPVNTILQEVETFNGKLAYVGLPDQVAAIRRLQKFGYDAARKIEMILGPYVGTYMYVEAIESFLRANGMASSSEVINIRYRDGEWPGNLKIELSSGRVFRAEKFHYNYLIPFFITASSLLSVDFTNELTDISVGDAWHPEYEKLGKGFSAVVTRSKKGQHVLRSMIDDGLIYKEEKDLEAFISMHAHMIEFKKRGAFIRMDLRKALGKHIPDYGYRVVRIPFGRKCIELFIAGIFGICSSFLMRRALELIPFSMIGPFFNALRKSWKSISKPTKRKGLLDLRFKVTRFEEDWSSAPE